jgi:hypothetical protein
MGTRRVSELCIEDTSEVQPTVVCGLTGFDGIFIHQGILFLRLNFELLAV